MWFTYHSIHGLWWEGDNLMEAIKTIALVAHDNRKQDLIEWIEWNYHTLLEHKIVCTGTTGKLVE
jgi:methylglyoxal synthase